MSTGMCRAIHDFKKSAENSLGFKQNDVLIVIQPVDENWYFGCLNDEAGFIPRKYVKEIQERDIDYMIKTVNACIGKLQRLPETNISDGQHGALKKLIKHRDALMAELKAETKQCKGDDELIQHSNRMRTPLNSQAKKQKQPAPPPPPQLPKQQQQVLHQKQAAPAQTKDQIKEPLSPPDPLRQNQPSKQQQQSPQTQPPPRSQKHAAPQALQPPHLKLPASLSRELVDVVRSCTRASHQSCRVAVQQVLTMLDSRLCDKSPEFAALIGQLAMQMMDSESDDERDEIAIHSPDWQAMDRLLASADRRRRDWQERGGWSLHEQESEVLDELEQLREIITGSDPMVAKRRIRSDGCSGPLCLAELLSSETRPAARLALVHCLSEMVRLSRPVFGALLCHSGLVTDLLREVTVGPEEASSKRQLLAESLRLLTMMFSTCIRPPVAVIDGLNEKFFVSMYHLLVSEDNESQKSDTCLVKPIADFILAANLLTGCCESSTGSSASVPVHERPLFRALLGTPDACRIFTEYLLMVFNRSEDPTAMLSHSPPPHNSVLQFMIDLFAHESTVAIFYSNDVRVLLDIIYRLLDKSSNDTKTLPSVLLLLLRFSNSKRYLALLTGHSDIKNLLLQLLNHDNLPENLLAQCRQLLQLMS